jgi:hypothetical protein
MLRRRLVLVNLTALAVLAQVALNPIDRLMPRFAPMGTPEEIVAAVSARHSHGATDDAQSVDALSKAAFSRPIVTTCGKVSEWTVAHLRDAGYEARVVVTLTLEEWNGTDNSHVMVEVREDGWVVYDPDRHVGYADPAGRPVSLRELVELVPTDEYAIVPLAGPVGEGLIRETNRRLFGVPGIEEGGLYWFEATGAEAERVRSYDPTYRTLAPAAWSVRFD